VEEAGVSAVLSMEAASARRGGMVVGPVDLSVLGGEVVALVGPNGAGKSTLLALATGELPCESGRVRLLGDDPARLKRREAALRVALVRQGAAPRMPMSAEELVLHGRWVHLSGLRFPGARDRQIARECLELFGVAGLASRDVRSLSGGEMQRVLLAKAQAQEARLLLLDEPTSSLDFAHRARVMQLVREVAAARGVACLVVSHDLDLVAATCDRVVLLAAGRILAAGTPEEAFRPDVLETAHGLPVLVDRHPLTGRPRVTVRLEGPRPR
jgi:iron complex transport system ATP-binding protein